MVAFGLFMLILLVLVAVSLILPWVQAGQIRALRRELDALRQSAPGAATRPDRPAATAQGQAAPAAAPAAGTTTGPERRPATSGPAFLPTPRAAPAESAQPPPAAARAAHPPPVTTRKASAQDAGPQPEEITLEQRLSARLPVWVGSIALAFAGFYLVKYSIESGLLGPLSRVLLGALFGIALLAGGMRVRTLPRLANGERIGQALSGAGIAVLYGCLFAAASLYHLVPPWLAFVGMAVVTAVAVALSLRQGAPIAVLGLAGGFLTPGLVGGGDPSVPMLFTYLYFLLAGVLMVARQRAWWGVAATAVAAGYLWVLLALWWGLGVHDGPWLAAYLLAVAVTGAFAAGGSVPADGHLHLRARVVGALAVVGAVLLMGPVTAQGGMELLEWTLFALLAAACVVLSARDAAAWGSMPLASLLVSATLLLRWEAPVAALHLTITGMFAVIHVLAPLLLMLRGATPQRWAGLATAAALAYFLAAFMKLHVPVPGLDAWGMTALVLAALWGVLAWHAQGRAASAPEPWNEPAALLTAGAGGFGALGLLITLDPAAIPAVFAIVLALLASARPHHALRGRNRLMTLFAALLTVTLLPYAILLLQVLAFSLVGDRILHGAVDDLNLLVQNVTGLVLFMPRDLPGAGLALLTLGIPAAALWLAAWRLHGRGESMLVQRLDLAAAGLAALYVYVLCRRLPVPDAELVFARTGFIDRGLVTNALLVLGIACVVTGWRNGRAGLERAGRGLCVLAALRLAWFDLLVLNPWWSAQAVGAMPVFNGITLTYGLPLVWMGLALVLLGRRYTETAVRWFGPLAAVMLFALVTLSVRQWFQGTWLDRGAVSEAELYSYSVAWLVLGICMMTAGAVFERRVMRFAALALMTVTVGKVFLVDAAELSGLYRVLSFLVLGFCLLGLSHVYTRFVERPGAARAPAPATSPAPVGPDRAHGG